VRVKMGKKESNPIPQNAVKPPPPPSPPKSRNKIIIREILHTVRVKMNKKVKREGYNPPPQEPGPPERPTPPPPSPLPKSDKKIIISRYCN